MVRTLYTICIYIIYTVNLFSIFALTISSFSVIRVGDPVQHYTARIKELYINGKRIGEFDTLYAVFDTGTSGCVLQDELFNDPETPNPPRGVSVVLEDEHGGEVFLSACATRRNLFVVTASDIGWFKYQRTNACIRRERNATCKKLGGKKPLVVVLGSAFLTGRVLTIDADQNRLLLTEPPKADVRPLQSATS